MNKSFKFKIDTYNCSVYFIITSDINKTFKTLLKKYNTTDPFDGKLTGAASWNYHCETYYILVQDVYLTHNFIAHEICHLTCSICKERDIVDEESHAYLTGSITEKIYRLLDKKKIVIHHG